MTIPSVFRISANLIKQTIVYMSYCSSDRMSGPLGVPPNIDSSGFGNRSAVIRILGSVSAKKLYGSSLYRLQRSESSVHIHRTYRGRVCGTLFLRSRNHRQQ